MDLIKVLILGTVFLAIAYCIFGLSIAFLYWDISKFYYEEWGVTELRLIFLLVAVQVTANLTKTTH